MGHTLPPFSQQFKHERSIFAEMRRALLLRDDKALFDEMWDKAEFHVPAAEKAKHPLPVFTIAMCMLLEAEKSIFQLGQKNLEQDQHILELEKKLEEKETNIALLRREVAAIREEIEQMRTGVRAELLEILYPTYVP